MALPAYRSAMSRLARPFALRPSRRLVLLPRAIAVYSQTSQPKSQTRPRSTAAHITETTNGTESAAPHVPPPFLPRNTFAASESIVRSYYLGHHASALQKMSQLVHNIDIVIECRDARIPVTSTNPKLEAALAGKERVIVYTKADLLAGMGDVRKITKRDDFRNLLDFHADTLPTTIDESNPPVPEDGALLHGDRDTPSRANGGSEASTLPYDASRSPSVMFVNSYKRETAVQVLALLSARAAAHESVIGLRGLIVGMPNAGKSSLLNVLRSAGLHNKRKSTSRTGDEPGVTRQIQTPVRVTEQDGDIPPVQVFDTPGVFVPYVGDVESMLKLALVGCVKDGIVPIETIADYLLFRLNLHDPSLYAAWCAPTNSIDDFLDAIGRKRGMLGAGGQPSQRRAADWIVLQWRKGKLGNMCLDDLSVENLRRLARKQKLEAGTGGPVSLRQAKKLYRQNRREAAIARHGAQS